MGGLIYGFSAYHLNHLYYGQTNLLASEWLPAYALCLLCATAAVGRRRTLLVVAAALALLCLVLSDWQYVVFALLFTGLWVVWATIARRDGRAAGRRGGDRVPLAPVGAADPPADRDHAARRDHGVRQRGVFGPALGRSPLAGGARFAPALVAGADGPLGEPRRRRDLRAGRISGLPPALAGRQRRALRLAAGAVLAAGRAGRLPAGARPAPAVRRTPAVRRGRVDGPAAVPAAGCAARAVDRADTDALYPRRHAGARRLGRARTRRVGAAAGGAHRRSGDVWR